MADIIAQKELDDLVLLDDINEENVGSTLSSRYRQGDMYTYIGPVLVATNPYKLLSKGGKSIYDDSVIDQYRGRTIIEMPPHVFAIAEDAYSSLLRYRYPQSVIVSGESGSGKTETCRQILAFIARVSGAYAVNSIASGGGRKPRGKAAAAAEAVVTTALRVKDRLVTSNTVLEAFGNAQTIRNDNSSRFGKLMEVFFKSNGIASGGEVAVYLLEKHRVIEQAPGERNFHVFHQLSSGAPSDLRQALHIGQPESYAYLSHEARKINGVNDAVNFKGLCECLRILGFEAADQRDLWRIMSTVLNLGNLEFTSEAEVAKEKEAAAKHKHHQGSDSDSDDEGGGDAGGSRKSSRAGSLAGSKSKSRSADSQPGQPDTARSNASGAGGGHSLNAHASHVVDEGDSGRALAAVASLLGVEPRHVEAAMTRRTIVVKDESTRMLQSAREARASRDSLAKALYEKLFQHVVKKVNESISVHVAAGNNSGATKDNNSSGASNAKAAASSSPGKDSKDSKTEQQNGASPAAADKDPDSAKSDSSGGHSSAMAKFKAMDQDSKKKTADGRNSTGSGAGKDSKTAGSKHSNADAGDAGEGGGAAPAAADDQAGSPVVDASAEGGFIASDEELKQLSIAILDIYGFETLENNGFDQLCINYVNERLQQLFIEATLKAEQEEYEAEGITWEPIPYFNNAVVVALIEGQGKAAAGVFPVLDDACNMSDSGADPDKLLHSLNKGLSKHEHYSAKKIADGRFTIKHYAGDVTYHVGDLVAANRDTLHNDLISLMVRAAGGASSSSSAAVTGSKGSSSGSSSGGLKLLGELFADKRSGEEKKKRPPTASHQFRTSVGALIATLSSTMPHYVRCIKPNDAKRALTVDEARFAHQVRYLGLVENVRVKRAGFAYRSDYPDFYRRYRMLSSCTWPPKDADPESQIRALMPSLYIHEKPRSATLGVGMSAAGPGQHQQQQQMVTGGGAASGPGRGGFAGRGMPRGGLAGGRPGPGRPPIGAPPPHPPAASKQATGGNPTAAAASTGNDLAHQMMAASSNSKGEGSCLPGDLSSGGAYHLAEGTDYQFGASKLFIRQPKHLFALEYMRTIALGQVVSKVAAVWRAFAGKRNYKKIVWAWKRMQSYAAAHVARIRFKRMRAAAITCQAAVRGFLVRKAPAICDLREGLGLVSWHGKTRRAMSLRWPRPPETNGDWLGIFSMAGTVAVPTAEAEGLARSMGKLRPPQPLSSIVFADHVLKIRQNYKVVRRALVVTSDFLLNIRDPWQAGGKINRVIAITDIERISMSHHTDCYVTIHVKGGGYAYTCIAQTKVQLAKALAGRYKALCNGAELPIEVGEAWKYRAYKGDSDEKARGISVQPVYESRLFEEHEGSAGLEKWEIEMYGSAAAGGGIQGGVGGRYAEVIAGRAVGVDAAHTEKHRPFHTLQADGRTLLVACPMPPKPRLAQLLTAPEKEALKRRGFRAVIAMKD